MVERWKPSVTVAAIVERVHAGVHQFLLVEEHTPEGLRLNNPAGHLEPDESPVDAVVREALEETARAFTPTHIVGIYLSRFVRPSTGEDVTYLRMAFGGHAADIDPALTLDEGIVRTLWLTLDEVRESQDRHRSELVLQCIEDHCAGRAYPLDLIVTGPSVHSPAVFGVPLGTAAVR